MKTFDKICLIFLVHRTFNKKCTLPQNDEADFKNCSADTEKKHSNNFQTYGGD